MYWLWAVLGTIILTPLPLALIPVAVFVKIRNKRLPDKNTRIDVINQATAQKITDLAAPEARP